MLPICFRSRLAVCTFGVPETVSRMSNFQFECPEQRSGFSSVSAEPDQPTQAGRQ